MQDRTLKDYERTFTLSKSYAKMFLITRLRWNYAKERNW